MSTSNFAYGSDEQTFEPVYGIAMSLLGKLLDIIKNDYKEDMSKVIKKMTSGLIDEDMVDDCTHYVFTNVKGPIVMGKEDVAFLDEEIIDKLQPEEYLTKEASDRLKEIFDNII